MAERDGLYKRGGIWWARKDPITGKPGSTHCRDLQAARGWRAHRERLAADPAYAASEAATLEHWVGRVIEAKKPVLSEASVQIYQQKLGHFLRVWGCDCRLASITPDLVDSYVRQRRTEHVTDHTICKEVSKLHTMLKLAKRSGAYSGELDVLKPPDLAPHYVPRQRALSISEVVRLLAVLPGPRGALVSLCVGLGVRLSEARKLLPTDVDLSMDPGRVFIGGTKTKGSRRTVPVLSLYRPMVEAAVSWMPLPEWRWVTQNLATACRRAGIERCTPNDLRRTHSTLLAEAGVDRDTIRRLLGHTTPVLVDTTYSQPSPEALAALAEERLRNREPIQVRYSPRDSYKGIPSERTAISGSHGRLAYSETGPEPHPGAEKQPTGPDGISHESTVDDARTLQPIRIEPDVQAYVAGQLAEAYPLAFSHPADAPELLAPLAKAADAIQSGSVPAEGGRRS